jgi:hypothetical protein
MAQWSNNNYFETNLIYGSNGSIGVDLASGELEDGYTASLNWLYRQLIASDGSVNLDWSDPSGKIYLGAASDDPTYLPWIQANADLVLSGGSDYGVIATNYFIADGGIYSSSGSGGQYMSVDSNNRTLNDESGNLVLEWAYGNVYGAAFVGSGYGNGLTAAATFPNGISVDTIAGLNGGGVSFQYDISLNNSGNNVGALDVNTLPIIGVYSIRNTTDQEFINGDARGLYDVSGYTSVDWGNRQLIANDGSTVMLNWSSNNGFVDFPQGLEAYDIDAAMGYTTQNGAAHFPYGLTANNQNITGVYFLQVDVIEAPSNTPPSFSFGAKLAPTAVASLVGGEGTINYVNNADTPVVGSAVVGGGSAKCLVCYNGTDHIVTSLL